MADDAYAEVDGAALSRSQIEVDGDEYRMYTDGDDRWPSVTTILDARPTPEKDKSLRGWRNWLKGQPDRPNPDEVMAYKGWRGTLAHYKCLADLASYDLAGDEELQAYEGLKGWEYNHDDALRQASEEVEWSVSEFRDMLDDLGVAEWDDNDELVHDRVRAVEQYVVDHDIGFAGQYDLAYELPDGDTVLADIKTSKADSVSGLINKKFPRYALQLSAYAHAVDFEVDHCHILWVAPDTRQSAIIPDREWPSARRVYLDEFSSIAEEVHQTTFEQF